jgi:hypothetical protein
MAISTIDGKECNDVQFFSSAANCKKRASRFFSGSPAI